MDRLASQAREAHIKCLEGADPSVGLSPGLFSAQLPQDRLPIHSARYMDARQIPQPLGAAPVHVLPHGCRGRAPCRRGPRPGRNTLARRRECSWPIGRFGLWSIPVVAPMEFQNAASMGMNEVKCVLMPQEAFPLAGSQGNQVESRRQPMFSRQACALARSSGLTARSRSLDWRSPTSPYSSKERIGPFKGITGIPARLKPFSTSANFRNA